MIDYGRVRGSVQPPEVEMTGTKVLVASNIVPFEDTLGTRVISGFEYDYKEYTKDEYITLLNENNSKAIADLQEQLAAAKILLGVE